MSTKPTTMHTHNLIELTKQPLRNKETSVERNFRLSVVIDTLAYLVAQRVEMSDMKQIMSELNQIIENS